MILNLKYYYYKLLSFRFACCLQAFPMFVRQSTVTTRNAPGISIIHQEPVIRAFSARDSILPQVIISTGSPIPIKLKVASDIMAVLTFMITMNIIAEKKFGVRCFHNIWKKLPPIHLDAITNSLFRI